ncbi:MAG: hypothetical protein EOO20_10175 [Chryseobacterium sp.]|nr:MAG: hypothetical protein EOO20_10175 [Chryseobacterium sp.]
MEQNSNAFEFTQVENSNMVVLDYLFGEGDGLQAYQLIRFSGSEVWNVLCEGFLLVSLRKQAGEWLPENGGSLALALLEKVGDFIDRQHFNLLPSRIKAHWEEFVQDVVMQTDSAYLVVAKSGVSFSRFERLFRSFVAELLEDPWPVSFKVYDADFEREFEVVATQRLSY